MADAAPIARSTFCSSLLLLQERGFSAGTVIDIGAAEGDFFLLRSQHQLFTSARHFFVDAMQENAEIYRKLGDRFAAGYEIAALSCMDGEVVMRVDPHYYNTHVDHLQPGSDYQSTRRVPVCTLDGLVARHELQPPYVLKIDVQGGELDVLRGALGVLEESVIVTAEIQVFFERDNLVELLAFMQGNGWALYDITDLAHYPSDRTFYQCYTTFIPKSMDFRKGLPWIQPGQEKAVYELLRARRASRIQALEALARDG
jgi:FkbM family methyltransferase